LNNEPVINGYCIRLRFLRSSTLFALSRPQYQLFFTRRFIAAISAFSLAYAHYELHYYWSFHSSRFQMPLSLDAAITVISSPGIIY